VNPSDTAPLTILIVEDNLSHQKITEYAFKHGSAPVRLYVVRDGQEVLDYLTRKGVFENPAFSPTPDLILLDLNLPKRDGREVLAMIKNDPLLKDLPVAIVSTSDREEDIQFAFRTGAIAYISKSSGFDRYVAEIGTVTRYARPRTS
jgi:two-component system, chemotaxis family, response regulator Rcp1